jgi:hypothetical protein
MDACPARKPGVLALAAGLTAAFTVAAAAQESARGIVWTATEGVVAVEIESVPPAKGWIEETALAGFTGRGYYTDTGGGDPLVFRIQILEAGRYQLRIRNRHEHPDATLENDCWTQMDDGPKVKTFSSQRAQWTWHTRHEHHDGDKPEASYELTAGLHTLRISGRSKGFRIDRFHLFREGAAGSTDERRPESRGVPGLGPLARLKGVGGLLDRMEYGAAMQAAAREARSADPETAAEARKVLDALDAHAAGRKEALARMKGAAPEEAAVMLAELARQYQPMPVGQTLAAEARAWAAEPTTRQAAMARAALAPVEEAAKSWLASGRGKAVDAARRRQEAEAIGRAIGSLRKRYPETPAARKALDLAAQMGVTPASE